MAADAGGPGGRQQHADQHRDGGRPAGPAGAEQAVGASSGHDQLTGSFKLLGVLLPGVGGALLVWGYILRGRGGAELET